LADAPVRSTPLVEPNEPTSGGAAPGGAASLAEDVDLELDLREHVLSLYLNLEQLDHYTLLGIAADADRKGVKRAYYELAARFHPDKYFRKRLGSYKVKMEAIFARTTLAHDTLSDRARRVEYDAYLREQRLAHGIEEQLANAPTEIRRAEARVEQEVDSTVPPRGAPATPPVPAPRANVDINARRDVLKSRLLGGRTPAPGGGRSPPSTSSTPPTTAPTTADAMATLRRRYEDRVQQAKVVQAQRYAARAADAQAEGDLAVAANSLRVASGLAPSDVDLQRKANEAQDAANKLLGETYTHQAQYEEKNGQWPEAARSWVKACRGRADDAYAHERAANAILKAGGDLHTAARLAQRACALAPASSGVRITLATVYMSAGLGLNARRELEAAARLAPHDGTIQAMMVKLGDAT
jgi:curved DNA-binding protein CbpA